MDQHPETPGLNEPDPHEYEERPECPDCGEDDRPCACDREDQKPAERCRICGGPGPLIVNGECIRCDHVNDGPDGWPDEGSDE